MKFLFLLLYNSGIFFYRLSIQIASLWNPKAKKWIDGRKNLFEEIQSQLQPNEYRVWFHCASVGEFEQGRPVMEAYRKKFPFHKIVLTFYSPSGFELRKNYSSADYIFYLPLDTAGNAKQFISFIDPRLAVFVKYEFWFHFLNELKRKQIPCIMISAIFRGNHLLFHSFAGPLRDVVKSFKKIFVQDENSLKLLQQNGFTNAELANDTRFDRVWEIAQSPKPLPLIEQFKAGKELFVAGSTWSQDEKLIAELIATKNEGWKWIIVPHEIEDSHITELQKRIPDAVLYSDLEAGKSLSNANVLIIDQVGFLSSVYQFADIAYIGGGFGSGIHNTLEAAVFGIPVLFGPNYQKFNEAKKLVETGGAKSVSNYLELKKAFEFYESDEMLVGELNRRWVQQQTGATEKIMKYLEALTSNSGASPV